MVPPKAVSPRFHRRPEARPEELIEAALRVFGERGFRQTTLEEVATRAGVSKGTVYLYFDSKDALFRAVVENNVITLIADAEAAARDHAGSATELLIDVVHRMWRAMSRPDMICMGRLVQSEMAQFPEVLRFYFEHVVQRHRRLLHEIAARGVANGEFRREALLIVPRIVPSIVLQLNQSRAMFGDLDHAAPSATALRDAILTLVLEGIGARGRGTAALTRRSTRGGTTVTASAVRAGGKGRKVAAKKATRAGKVRHA